MQTHTKKIWNLTLIAALKMVAVGGEVGSWGGEKS